MDFNVFWHSAKALLDGENIYYDTAGPDSSYNPPFWTVLISPLGFLQPIVAYRAFVFLMFAVTVGYLAWTADELSLRGLWTGVGTGMLLISSPLLGTLALGQMYPLLGLGLAAAWVADRRGKPKVAGCALGLVVALKPSFAPVVMWPLIRRRWRTFAAALASGAAATLVGVVVAGPRSMLDYLKVLSDKHLDGYWDNASLPGSAARLFRENDFVEPLVVLPGSLAAAVVLGIGLIILTAAKVRQNSETGLWALVAASLLASPVAWHNYLVILGPGILLLAARGRASLAFLLLALQTIPLQWVALWEGKNTPVATLALTLYLYILVAHWLAFLLSAREEPASGPGAELEDRWGQTRAVRRLHS